MARKPFQNAKVQAQSSFVDQVYDVAYQAAGGMKDVIALLKSGQINWNDTKRVDQIGDAFKLAWMARILDLDRASALKVSALKNHSALPTMQGRDDTRTQPQQRAYNAAKSAWSYACKQAGMPDKRTGTERTSGARGKVAQSAPQVVTQVVEAEPEWMSPAHSQADTLDFAKHVAQLLLAYQAENAKHVPPELARVLVATAAQLRALAKSASGVTVHVGASSSKSAHATH